MTSILDELYVAASAAFEMTSPNRMTAAFDAAVYSNDSSLLRFIAEKSRERKQELLETLIRQPEPYKPGPDSMIQFHDKTWSTIKYDHCEKLLKSQTGRSLESLSEEQRWLLSILISDSTFATNVMRHVGAEAQRPGAGLTLDHQIPQRS